MSATAGYHGKVYIIDDSIAFSTAFSAEATTEAGVTKKYQIDDTSKRIWDINYGIIVGGYWAFQEFGLSTTSGANSGLASATQYYFKIAIDGGSVTEYNITTGAGTVTWGDLVALIDAQITGDGATCEFLDGDIRIHSDDTSASSDVSCSEGTTGTSLFGAGSVPAVGALETIDYTDIVINTAGYADSGIDYGTGTVQMSHTGFSSLSISGKYHVLKSYAQFTGYNITINCNAVDTTALQNSWKTNVPTTKNVSASLDGVYTDDEFFSLQANGILFTKIYINYSDTVGYQFFGTLSYNASVTPHEVVRESLNIDVTGNITYFTA